MSDGLKSDGSKNFSLRLSADDQARLERVAQRFDMDRTGALRLLIRRADTNKVLAANGHFVTVERGRTGRDFPIRLMSPRSANDAG